VGITQDPFKKEVRFRTPTFPSFIDEVELEGLKAGSGSADVDIRRHGDRTSLEVLSTRGHIDVKTELEDQE